MFSSAPAARVERQQSPQRDEAQSGLSQYFEQVAQACFQAGALQEAAA